MPETTYEKFDSPYFIKLAATLAILAAIWFGSNFLHSTSPNPKNNDRSVDSSRNNAPAATLSITQNAFLLPLSDAIKPIRKWSVPEPDLTSQSILAIDTGSGKTLLQKDAQTPRPIASISKLMTALITMENANLNATTSVSKDAVATYGEMGNLIANETISVESLLKAMLIESSNDAAVALAESINGGDGQFINLMNERARKLNLKNTDFSDPSGLTPENVSSAQDLIKLLQETSKFPILGQIMRTQETDIFSSDGKYKSNLKNSDKLLAKYPEIIAGKTGFIDESGECMILALQSPNSQGMIINVILNSQDRIAEMDELIQWEKEAFIW